jgi:hypothetical protein
MNAIQIARIGLGNDAMKPKDIKVDTWYKIKGNVFYPYFYAKRLHRPKSVVKSVNAYLVEGVHVSGHPPSLDFGLIKFIQPMNLVRYDIPPNAEVCGPAPLSPTTQKPIVAGSVSTDLLGGCAISKGCQMTVVNMSRPVEACHTFVVAKELIKAWNQSGAPGGQTRLAEVHSWARRMFPDIAVKTRSATELIDELMEWAFVQSVLVCVHEGVASGCPESNPPNAKDQGAGNGP